MKPRDADVGLGDHSGPIRVLILTTTSYRPSSGDNAWSAELDERVRGVREGTVELIDGDEMLAELDTIANQS